MRVISMQEENISVLPEPRELISGCRVVEFLELQGTPN
jgi:hypothetical protein